MKVEEFLKFDKSLKFSEIGLVDRVTPVLRLEVEAPSSELIFKHYVPTTGPLDNSSPLVTSHRGVRGLATC